MLVGKISQHFMLNFLEEATYLHEFNNIILVLLYSCWRYCLFTAGCHPSAVYCWSWFWYWTFFAHL